MDGIFKTYDIRGLYPDKINYGIMRRIGFDFARYLKKDRIVIGHDMRDSSPGLNRAFSK